MAFEDPIEITVNSVDYDFARTAFGADSSTYRTANGLDVITFSHQYKGRNRFLARHDRRKVAADPFDSSVNAEYSMSVQTVIDVPQVGFTAAEAVLSYQVIAGILSASTYAKATRLVQGEV